LFIRELRPTRDGLRDWGVGETRDEISRRAQSGERPEVRKITVHAPRDVRGRLHRGQVQETQMLRRGHVRYGFETKVTENPGRANHVSSES